MQSYQIQPELIDSIAELPPDYLLGRFPTQDQRLYFSLLRLFYSSLSQSLEDWFAGVPPGESPILKELPWVKREDLEAWRDCWIALYAVIYDGWDCLKAGEAWADMPPQTPGELFKWILECRATSSFLRCKGAYRYSPRAEYEYSRLLAKQPRGLSSQQEKRLTRLSNTLTAPPEEQQLLLVERYALSLLESAGKKSNRIRKKLRDFTCKQADLQTATFRDLHPSKRPKGLQWINGSYRRLS